MESETDIFLASPGPGDLSAIFEDDGETGYLYLYRQGAPSGQGILNAVHVYDREQCPTVRRADIQLGWNPGQTACWVRVGEVYRELPLMAARAS